MRYPLLGLRIYPKGRTSIVNDTRDWLGSPLKGFYTWARLGKGARGPIFYLTSSPDSNERQANSIFYLPCFYFRLRISPDELRVIADSLIQDAK